MLTIRASSPLGIYPCPARGPLLPCITDCIFNAVHYPGFSVVIAAFFEAFCGAHEAFPLFQDSKGFSILQNIFLFSIHFPFMPVLFFLWTVRLNAARFCHASRMRSSCSVARSCAKRFLKLPPSRILWRWAGSEMQVCRLYESRKRFQFRTAST